MLHVLTRQILGDQGNRTDTALKHLAAFPENRNVSCQILSEVHTFGKLVVALTRVSEVGGAIVFDPVSAYQGDMEEFNIPLDGWLRLYGSSKLQTW